LKPIGLSAKSWICLERDPRARIRLIEVVYFGTSSGDFEAEGVPAIVPRQPKKRLMDHRFQL
jgi:hypothetical protein